MVGFHGLVKVPVALGALGLTDDPHVLHHPARKTLSENQFGLKLWQQCVCGCRNRNSDRLP